ncbi:fungal-specific transcription factor domain-containing protein [Zalerion maritima]|uniref:Fungal-specific transcription factor domain-containing protein n=1 Tax=Zalerion maritima TaxID=339359 RepID=A0AAD5S1W3_9PEZI|nr:fungal-specific transcription factor domain-containing protein [Zalerion maritima]
MVASKTIVNMISPPGEAVVTSTGSLSSEVAASKKDPPKKRRRLVISCTECHRRKVKCDRKLPCSNCRSRNKESSCRYETLGSSSSFDGQSNAAISGAAVIKVTHAGNQSLDSSDTQAPSIDEEAEVVDLHPGLNGLGYVNNGCTIEFLNTIKGSFAGISTESDGLAPTDQGSAFGMRERYKSLTRQLPPRNNVESLVEVYFREFDWHLDRDVFHDHLSEWYSVPFNLLQEKGPMVLSPDVRVFPALLFQTLANALIILPRHREAEFEALKYSGGMSFEDLGLEYSEAGDSIVTLLGKRQMTEMTVLAGFVRCGFLKYTGRVLESEVGVYSDDLDPKPQDENSEESRIRNAWRIQRRRRLWMSLVSWDLHSSMILGRPPTIDITAPMPTPPIDAHVSASRYSTYPHLRDPEEPPTRLTRSVWVSKTMQPLKDILTMGKESRAGPEACKLVDIVHESISRLEREVPPFFDLDHADTRFDSHPDCAWVPGTRMLIKQIIASMFMALHRPFVFSQAHSRREALRACLTILDVQRIQFVSLPPHQYRQFTLFFGPFDAAVLIAAVYTLFPNENENLLRQSLQHFRWTIDRFEAIASRNKPAKAAVGVLRGIEARFQKAVGKRVASGTSVVPDMEPLEITRGSSKRKYQTRWRTGRQDAPPSYQFEARQTTMPGAGSKSRQANRWKVFGPDNPPPHSASKSTAIADTSNSSESEPRGTDRAETAPAAAGCDDWALPKDFDFAAIAPVFPTGDLLEHDLVGIPDVGGGEALVDPFLGDSPVSTPVLGAGNGQAAMGDLMRHMDDGVGGYRQQQRGAGNTAATGSGGSLDTSNSMPWSFEGGFAQDSLWSFLNQYDPV